ncbi:MAG: hypothetical protein V2I43_05410, partial [Parvularcula sp.]|nr:hypothetical protein [Parvularcula sp.]
MSSGWGKPPREEPDRRRTAANLMAGLVIAVIVLGFGIFAATVFDLPERLDSPRASSSPSIRSEAPSAARTGVSRSTPTPPAPRRPPSDIGDYEFLQPYTYRVVRDRVTPTGRDASGPLRFWQCVAARRLEGGRMKLRIRGG